MRKIGLLLCLGLLLGGTCMAQKQEVKDPLSLKLGVVIDKNETAKIEAPMFNGGEQALLKYIINNLRYPGSSHGKQRTRPGIVPFHCQYRRKHFKCTHTSVCFAGM